LRRRQQNGIKNAGNAVRLVFFLFGVEEKTHNVSFPAIISLSLQAAKVLPQAIPAQHL
jgi:hypothetical protein